MGDVYSGEFQNEQDGGVVRIHAEGAVYRDIPQVPVVIQVSFYSKRLQWELRRGPSEA